jgi:flagellar hook-associated protein 2
MSQFSVSGAVSGLDTASLINSLMQVEGQQQASLTTKQTAAKKAADAYGTLINQLNGLSDKAKALAKTSSWTGSTVTSSSTSVGVRSSGSSAASLTFDVTQVAAAHAVISSESVSSTGAQVASGALTLTGADGSTTTISPSDGSLASVVSALNSAKAGVIATAVQTGAGAYRLQVVSSSTGADSAFTLDGLDGFTGMNVLTQASDAQITVGSNPATAYSVSSASNTFGNLVDGLSFTVSRVESGVTVSSTVDGSTVADQVSSLVDTANTVLTTLATQSAHSSGANTTAGPLSGETAVRSLTQQILNTVSGAGAAGVSLTRDGKLSFDRTRFLTAFAADPAATARSYGASATLTAASGVTGTVSLSSAGDTSKAGDYTLNVSAAALREQWQLDPPGAIVAGRTIVVQRGSTTISYTAGASESMSDVVAALHSRLSRAGFGVSASENNGSLVLTADSAGASQAFSANIDGSGVRVTAGQDVAGTIDGQAAVGSGNLLSLRTGTGGAVGLSLRVDVTGDDVAGTGGAVGSVGYKPGLAQSLVSVIQTATASSGSLTTAQASRSGEVDDLQKQIDGWTTRLDAKRLSLQKQFTAMETTLATLKSQTAALSGLSTSSTSTSSTG